MTQWLNPEAKIIHRTPAQDEIKYPVFKKMADLEPEESWKLIFLEMSRRRCPKNYVLYYERNCPSQFYLKTKKRKLKIDMIGEIGRQQIKDFLTWKPSPKPVKIKRLSIDRLISLWMGDLVISSSDRRELMSLIRIYRRLNLIRRDTCIIDRSSQRLIKIRGLERTETGKFYFDRSQVRGRSKPNTKKKPRPDGLDLYTEWMKISTEMFGKK